MLKVSLNVSANYSYMNRFASNNKLYNTINMKQLKLLFQTIILCVFNSAIAQNTVNETTHKNATIVTRKTLLENYVGIHCGNCPPATKMAEHIDSLYATDISVLTVHAGYFAIPSVIYPIDFRTQTGEDWDVFFAISSFGIPNGMINRKVFPTDYIFPYSQWQAEVSNYIGQPADAKIALHKSYNTISRLLDVNVTTTFLNALSDSFKIMVVLAENNLVTHQLDYALPIVSFIDTNYIYNHVLRQSLTGSWGVLLNTNSVMPNDSSSTSILNFPISPSFNDNNIDVIAFVYNASTYEVIQVERTKLNPLLAGLKNLDNNFNFNIYPNPNTGNATINLTEAGIITMQLKVYDVNGRVVFEDTAEDMAGKNYDLKVELKSGMYFVEVVDLTTDAHYKQKLVIQQ